MPAYPQGWPVLAGVGGGLGNRRHHRVIGCCMRGSRDGSRHGNGRRADFGGWAVFAGKCDGMRVFGTASVYVSRGAEFAVHDV